MNGKLGLEINENKITLVTLQHGVDFLKYHTSTIIKVKRDRGRDLENHERPGLRRGRGKIPELQRTEICTSTLWSTTRNTLISLCTGANRGKLQKYHSFVTEITG